MGDIHGYFNGLVLAMAGEKCVSIASDLRCGQQMLTIGVEKEKVYKMGQKLYMGLPGLITDTDTVYGKMKFRKNLYELNENRRVRPKTFAVMLSNMLYEKRFGSYFLEPVVAGLDDVRRHHQPYICGMDSLGNMTQPKDFVASGNGESCIFGLAENYWREKMNPDELMEATCQTLLGALEREASCGWGAVVYVITPDRLIAKTLKGRMD